MFARRIASTFGRKAGQAAVAFISSTGRLPAPGTPKARLQRRLSYDFPPKLATAPAQAKHAAIAKSELTGHSVIGVESIDFDSKPGICTVVVRVEPCRVSECDVWVEEHRECAVEIPEPS
jgi:hypothetical protein